MAKRAVFIFKVTLFGFLEREAAAIFLDTCALSQTTRPNIRFELDLHQHTANRSIKSRKNTMWEKKSVNIYQTTRRQARENRNLLFLMANIWVKKLRKITRQCESSRSYCRADENSSLLGFWLVVVVIIIIISSNSNWHAVKFQGTSFLITKHISQAAWPTRWNSNWYITKQWARGGAVGWGTALQAGKVAGSIPDGVTGIFHWHNPFGRTMALGLTQPLLEMSTRNISWGVKAAGE